MSLVVAFVQGTLAWFLPATRWRIAAAVLAIAAVALALGGAMGLPLYPWTDVPVIAAALCGGLLMARVLPPRAVPMLVLLSVLAALDAVQLFLPGPGPSPASSTHSAAYDYYMLSLPAPLPGFAVGIADLLLIGAMAAHAHRRGLPFVAGVAPGVIGFGLADASLLLWSHANLPLVPFLLAGWLATEAGLRLVWSPHPAE